MLGLGPILIAAIFLLAMLGALYVLQTYVTVALWLFLAIIIAVFYVAYLLYHQMGIKAKGR